MIRRILIGLVRLYLILISPLLAPSCRFYPSCSAFTIEALQKHGSAKGLLLSAQRICKCHPFHPGGVDRVPEPGMKAQRS